MTSAAGPQPALLPAPACPLIRLLPPAACLRRCAPVAIKVGGVTDRPKIYLHGITALRGRPGMFVECALTAGPAPCSVKP